MLLFCQRCNSAYIEARSTSRWLRLTYCSTLCEVADNGAAIEDMLAWRRDARPWIRQARDAWRKAHPERRPTYWDWFREQTELMKRKEP